MVASMNATYTSPDGATYVAHETTFVNPGNGLETLLFVLVNESGAVVRVTAASMEAARWVEDFDLTLDKSF